MRALKHAVYNSSDGDYCGRSCVINSSFTATELEELWKGSEAAFGRSFIVIASMFYSTVWSVVIASGFYVFVLNPSFTYQVCPHFNSSNHYPNWSRETKPIPLCLCDCIPGIPRSFDRPSVLGL